MRRIQPFRRRKVEDFIGIVLRSPRGRWYVPPLVKAPCVDFVHQCRVFCNFVKQLAQVPSICSEIANGQHYFLAPLLPPHSVLVLPQQLLLLGVRMVPPRHNARLCQGTNGVVVSFTLDVCAKYFRQSLPHRGLSMILLLPILNLNQGSLSRLPEVCTSTQEQNFSRCCKYRGRNTYSEVFRAIVSTEGVIGTLLYYDLNRNSIILELSKEP